MSDAVKVKRINHAAKASDALRVAEDAAALVHATLAVYEQQRLANLLVVIDKWGGESGNWPLAIREQLGLS